MDRATRFIESAVQSDTPFFAVIWFHAPHTPVVASEQQRALYPNHPNGLYGQHYHGSISALDDQIGRLRSRLSALGKSNDTMLWYCSDNGPESQASTGAGSAGPFRGRKRSLYEGGVRVPGLLVWPDQIKSSSVNTVPCVTSDYFPTILDALDLPMPKRSYDGISLLPLIRGESQKRDTPIFFQSKNVATIHRDQFKLVSIGTQKDKISGAKVELYDLEKDPAEANNLAATQAQLAKELRTQLASWIESCARSDRGEEYR